jgi:hypothetical protein
VGEAAEATGEDTATAEATRTTEARTTEADAMLGESVLVLASQLEALPATLEESTREEPSALAEQRTGWLVEGTETQASAIRDLAQYSTEVAETAEVADVAELVDTAEEVTESEMDEEAAEPNPR